MIFILFLIDLFIDYYHFFIISLVSLKYCEITIIDILIKYVIKGTIKIKYKSITPYKLTKA